MLKKLAKKLNEKTGYEVFKITRTITLCLILGLSIIFTTMGIIGKPQFFISWFKYTNINQSSLELKEKFENNFFLEIELKKAYKIPGCTCSQGRYYYSLSAEKPKNTWEKLPETPAPLKSAQLWIDKDLNNQKDVGEIHICKIRTLNWKEKNIKYGSKWGETLVCGESKVKVEWEKRNKELKSQLFFFFALSFFFPLLITGSLLAIFILFSLFFIIPLAEKMQETKK